MESFATHLSELMKLIGETNMGLARKWRPESIQPTRRMIQTYIAGTHVPTPRVRDEIAAALGVRPSLLPLAVDGDVALLADLMAVVQRLEQRQAQIMEKVA